MLPLMSRAQNYVQVGPTVYPMSAWGAGLVGDFRVVNLAPKLTFGIGAMAVANASKTHDKPNVGKRIISLYVAPQVGLHLAFSSKFDGYVRGGAGWVANIAEGKKTSGQFMYNGVLGAGLSLCPYLGLYAEAGLPFSSLGLRFAF